MYLPLLNYVVLHGLAVDFANIEDLLLFNGSIWVKTWYVYAVLIIIKWAACASPPSTMFTHGEAIYLLLLIDSLFLSHEATTMKSISLNSRQTNDSMVWEGTLNGGTSYIIKSAYLMFVKNTQSNSRWGFKSWQIHIALSKVIWKAHVYN